MYNLLESQYFSVRSQEGENRQLGILLLLSFFPIGVWLLFPLLVMSLGINDTFASDSHSLMPALYEGSPSALSFEYFASHDFSWSLGHTSPFYGRSVLGVLWKDWCWSWNSSILATSCEELSHWKRPWCWEGLGAGGEGDDRAWDGWMASPTRWTWVWVNSGRWWWTGRPGVLQFMGSQRVGHDWATELNWTGTR